MEQRNDSTFEEQFNDLWQSFEPYIRNLCNYKLISMPHYIDDCVQETFMALALAIKNEKTIDCPKAWLTSVANNKIKDVYECERKKSELIVNLSQVGVFHQIAFTDIEHIELSEEEIVFAVNSIIEQLTENEKALFEERFIKKMKTAELAIIHKTSKENIRQQIFRLKKKANKLIKKYVNNQNAQK